MKPYKKGDSFNREKNYLTSNSSENRVVSANTWTKFFVLLFGVTNVVEFRSRSKHTSTKPNCITLHVMSNNIDFKSLSLNSSTTELFTNFDTVINSTLNISLKTATEISKHS